MFPALSAEKNQASSVLGRMVIKFFTTFKRINGGENAVRIASKLASLYYS